MSLTFHYDPVNRPSLTPNKGPVLSTYDRASDGTFYDHDGVLRSAVDDQPRYVGFRRVENKVLRSEDFTTGWANSNLTLTTGQTDPFGNTSATRLTADAGNATLSAFSPLGAGVGDFTNSVWIRRVTGTGNILMQDSTTAYNVVDVTSEWQRFNVTGTGTSRWYIAFRIATSGDEIEIFGAQVEDVSFQEDWTMSEYQMTGASPASAYYANRRRTNRLVDTDNLDNTSVWAIGADATTVTDTDLPPGVSGITQSWNLNTNTNNAQHEITQSAVSVPHLNYEFDQRRRTHSIYAKFQPGSSYQEMMCQVLANGNHQRIAYDLLDGSVTETNANIIPQAGEHVGDDWWYFEWSYIPTDGFSSHYFTVMPHDGTSPSGIFVGDGTGILIAAPQQELGDRSTAFIANDSDTDPASTGFNTVIIGEGQLFEDERTNICPESETLSTAPWALGANTVVNVDQAIAPDGTLTADEIVDDGLGGASSTIWTANNNITVATSTAYVFSYHVRDNAAGWAKIEVAGSGVQVIEAYIRLSDGVLGATLGADNDDQGVIDLENGWYRGWIAFTSDAVDTTLTPRVTVAEADGDTALTRDGTNSIYAWGSQLETGVTPSAYIKTIASSVTREEASAPLQSVAGLINDASGILYAEITSLFSGSKTAQVVNISDASNNNSVGVLKRNTDGYQSTMTSGGVSQAALDATGVFSAGNNVTAAGALGYAENNVEWYVDGARTLTGDQVATPPVGLDTMNINQRADGLGANTTGSFILREIRYYNSWDGDAQIIEDISNGAFPASGGGAGVKRRARDASAWYNQMKLKTEDEEAKRLVRQYLE